MSNKKLDDQYKNSKNSYEVFYDHDDETEVTQYLRLIILCYK